MAGLQMKYFVLKPSASGWHGEASRAALEAYENVLLVHHENELAEDLRTWRAKCTYEASEAVRDTGNVWVSPPPREPQAEILCERCHKPYQMAVNGICVACDPTGGGTVFQR